MEGIAKKSKGYILKTKSDQKLRNYSFKETEI